ncbi:hypothetical protein [Lacrimispora xylanolytica]|uniref:Uncharacterized protein n=1 Tax=Lacrimispora xylanolytica TaxID=29375 RepID=A0ABY7ADU0_9FIRM|nr:hypothetical protein [Lacrimispora xylanolytica]WAJ23698.1 hypothetical protein OW255_19420 [Lacrimispora xylanolytica]
MQNVVTDPMSKYQTKLPLSFVKNSGQEDSRVTLLQTIKDGVFSFLRIGSLQWN